MKRMILIWACLILCAGCSTVCSFGRSDGSGGFECRSMDAKVTAGMSAQKVEAMLGAPSRRNINVSYRGKTYDEAWLYETSPNMILYFKDGVFDVKDYQQSAGQQQDI